jgi:hypothetical protein
VLLKFEDWRIEVDGMRIVFMGTPDFAVPSLKALKEAGHVLAAVVTRIVPGAGEKLIHPPRLRKLPLLWVYRYFSP